MDGICKVYGDFLLLEYQHPDDWRDLVDAVHVVQNLLACRIARCEYPDGWVLYSEIKGTP